MLKDRSPRRRPETTSRQKPEARHFRWGLLLALVPILTVAGLTYAVLRSPLLSVQEIRVEGTQTLDQTALAQLSGLEGKSMLRLPDSKARANLLAIPAVRSVSIERNWPHSVTLKVVERTPVAFWSVGGQDYAVDQDGVVLAAGAPDGPAPRIVEIADGKTLHAGDRVHPEAIALAERVTKESPKFLGESVDRLEYQAGIGVTIVFDGGMRVTFGDERSYDYKIAVLSNLLDNLMAKGIEPHSVDLRFGERVTYE